MKNRLLPLLLSSLFCMVFVVSGCDSSGTGAGSSAAGIAEKSSSAASVAGKSSESTGASALDSSRSTSSAAQSPDISAYKLDKKLGAAPDCRNPVETRGTQRDSADGKWYVDDGITIGDTILVNCRETSFVVNKQKSLGTEWKVGASFRPIQNNTDSSQPICSRLWITNASGADVFLLTVNNIPGTAVEITLEMFNRAWLKIYTPQEWISTDSDVFYFELSREKGSKKLHLLVMDKNGELLSKDSPKIKDDILDSAVAGGLGVFNSATEYFYWDIKGNGPKDFQYPSAE